ncbi:MAG TPA: hypothetical protein VMZ53_28875 [Kofleriaceae bacterium]|nr:hypothetical protein [Kofleriaceae bacterium]
MLKKIVVALVVVFGSACIDDGVNGTPGSLPTDETPEEPGIDTPAEMPQTALTERSRQQNPGDPAVCELLPQDDSACAHACDEDVLLTYIPEGTCASFACPLTDGTTFVTGGCN